MNKKKKNIYICHKCNKSIVTIDIDDGVTPFMIDCQVNSNCKGTMYSYFYEVNQLLKAEFEWYKPKSINDYPEEYREVMKKHIDDGGLDIRPIKGD